MIKLALVLVGIVLAAALAFYAWTRFRRTDVASVGGGASKVSDAQLEGLQADALNAAFGGAS
jgi:uncharacterized membrane protein